MQHPTPGIFSMPPRFTTGISDFQGFTVVIADDHEGCAEPLTDSRVLVEFLFEYRQHAFRTCQSPHHAQARWQT